MGQNLVLNMAGRGFRPAVYNRTVCKVDEFLAGRAAGTEVVGARDLREFARLLKPPRAVILTVKAGSAVDVLIDKLIPLLGPEDIIVDGGNSFFMDTRRRCLAVQAQDLCYLGMGISGGEQGALRGPCLMLGGHRRAYRRLEPILTAIAASVDGEACCVYLGPDAAGHYAKMVHNGIEYADMELIAEAYHLMKEGLGLTSEELHEVFAAWNEGVINSYLIEITRDIFKRRDPERGGALVEAVLDVAEQKGTGRWTSQSALELNVPVPTMTAAVSARSMSAMKDERAAASRVLTGPSSRYRGERKAFIAAIHDALYASKVCTYAQGMALLRAASNEYSWSPDFGAMANLWRGSCIIRARFLNRIGEAFVREPDLPNLLLDPYFLEEVSHVQENWRTVVATAATLGIPTPGFSASLEYFDSYRRDRLPANLIQAQRDYFGAHTYARSDMPGTFHTDWAKAEG
jgi:6-phosphogluconate dehydrogenase